MLLAYDYPLLGLFWTMLIFFVWVAWLVVLIRVFADIFRNHEMGGLGKACWSIFVILVPFLGVFVYLLAHGSGMVGRDHDAARRHELRMETYMPPASGTVPGTADELAKLADLKARGVLTDEEFDHQKNKLLGAI
jgi:hypothetical protein